MPTVPITLSIQPADSTIKNTALPRILQTPSGLALVEIQGTFNGPQTCPEDSDSTAIGRLVFEGFDSDTAETGISPRKTVHFYIGQHQRMTGEIKKLTKPIAVIRKKTAGEEDHDHDTEQLEIVEIVHYKLLFASRPEPVGH